MRIFKHTNGARMTPKRKFDSKKRFNTFYVIDENNKKIANERKNGFQIGGKYKTRIVKTENVEEL